MAPTKKKMAFAGVAVAGVGAVIALLAWWFPIGSDDADRVDIDARGDVAVSPTIGANGCVVIQGDCVLSDAADPEAAREAVEALPSATSAPDGHGPWMFMVYGTADLGLYVRDGFAEDDSRLPESPTLDEGTGTYAECRVDDGWIADPLVSEIGRWYKVGYPEAADSGDFWVYGGYVLPVGHNGEVPLCTEAQRQ